MSRRRICVVVSARPSYSRVKSVLRAIREHPDLELQIVVTAWSLLERYGNVARIIEDDGFEISERAVSVLEGDHPTTMAASTGLALIETANILQRLQPGFVVTIADRHETLATAAAAAYMNIPLAHLQGGEVSGSIDEKVRHAVTKLSDLHLVSTARAAERVIQMGENPTTVWVTGCPSLDLAAEVLQSSGVDLDLFAKYETIGPLQKLSSPYLVVLQHPVTSEREQSYLQMTETLHAVKRSGLPALVFSSNGDAGIAGIAGSIQEFREANPNETINYLGNMDPVDFLRVVNASACVVGNSSIGLRECSFLGVPAVNIGTRQTGRERAENVLDAPYDRDAIEKAIARQARHGRYSPSTLYGTGDSGKAIAQILSEVSLNTVKILTY